MEVSSLILTLTMALLSLGGLTSFFRRARPPRVPSSTEFYGSQLGGESVINYSYTDLPWMLLSNDILYFFKFIWALPYILLPATPADSGDLDELAFTRKNVFCIAVHFVICVLQLAGIVGLPFLILLPVWAAILLVALFMLVNYGLCSLLNGREVEYWSDPKYAEERPEHAHEQWIFINGVAVG